MAWGGQTQTDRLTIDHCRDHWLCHQWTIDHQLPAWSPFTICLHSHVVSECRTHPIFGVHLTDCCLAWVVIQEVSRPRG